jgi:HdeA/HdeB family
VQCAQLLGADDDDRQAAMMFYYGYLTARSGIHVIDVSRIDQNIRRVIDQYTQTPNATVVQAYTRAFGRKLTH